MSRKTFLWVMLGSFGISALLGVVAILAQSSDTVRVLVCSIIINLTLIAIFLSMLLKEFGHSGLRWLMMTGMIVAIPTGMLWLMLVLLSGRGGSLDEESIARIAGGMTFFVLWCIYTGYCFCFPVRMNWYRCLVWGLFLSGSSYLLLLELLVIDPDIVEGVIRLVFQNEDVFFRLLSAQIVLSSAASLALPVIHLIRKVLHGGEASLAERVELTIECPRCEFSQRIPVGGARCARCRLEIRVNLEEPRCSCGFLLYRFSGDVCPECGRPVADHLRWTPTPE